MIRPKANKDTPEVVPPIKFSDSIAAAGPKLLKATLTFSLLRFATEIPDRLTRGLAGSFLIGALLMA
jgi:hypothetical protein